MPNSKSVKILISVIILLFITGILVYVSTRQSLPSINQSTSSLNLEATNNTVSNNTIINSLNNNSLDSATNSSALLFPPISSALERVTKKPFGIYITPKNSPVSPERFTGFHTGVDFEILPGEENKDVWISAVCSGALLVKEYANGYGGVVIESCKLDKEDVTIIYGHLKLASLKIKPGDKIIAGENIGILGKGYSTETSGERKHLHLGVHKGMSINIKGYVQNKDELNNWLDALKFLK